MMYKVYRVPISSFEVTEPSNRIVMYKGNVAISFSDAFFFCLVRFIANVLD